MTFEQEETVRKEIFRLRAEFPEDTPLNKLAKDLVFEDRIAISSILKTFDDPYQSFEEHFANLQNELEEYVDSKRVIIKQSTAVTAPFWTDEQVKKEKIRLRRSKKIVVLEDLKTREEYYKSKHNMSFTDFKEIKVRNWEGKVKYIVFDYSDELTIGVTSTPFWKSYKEDLWDEELADYIFSSYEENFEPVGYGPEERNKAIVFESRETPYYELIKKMNQSKENLI